MIMAEVVRVAVIQDCPVPFDLAGTVTKVEQLIANAAKTGAELIVFPEAFISGYPKGLDFGARVGMRSPQGREAFRRYYESALVLNSDECRHIWVSSAIGGSWSLYFSKILGRSASIYFWASLLCSNLAFANLFTV
jgi:hypothetical protein